MNALHYGVIAFLLAGCPKKGDTTTDAGSATPEAGQPGAVGAVEGASPEAAGEPVGSFEDRYDEAVALIQKGDVESLKAAQGKLEALGKERPELGQIPYDLGIIATELDDLDGARKYYMRATDLDPKIGDAWLNLGALSERAGNLQNALSSYETGLRYQPDNDKLIVGIIGVLRKLGRTDEAIEKAKAALVKNANNVDAYNNLGLVYVDQGKLDLAMFIYQKALTIENADRNALLHCNLGKVYLLRGDLALARQQLERSLELDPDLVASMMFLASDRLDNHDWTKAAEYLERARALEPENPAIAMNLGIAYRGLGRYDEAKAQYEKTLNLDRENPDPYLNLAVLLGGPLKQYDDALADIQKYRDSGGRDLALADAWEKDIQDQKKKYEMQIERDKRRKEREARDAERARLAAEDEANQKKWQEEEEKKKQEQEAQQNGQTPPPGDGTTSPPPGDGSPWGGGTQDGSTPPPTPAPTDGSAPPTDGTTPPTDGTQPSGGSPWGGTP